MAAVSSSDGGGALASDAVPPAMSIFHRRIEFHPARKPYSAISSGGGGGFYLETLNPSSSDLQRPGSAAIAGWTAKAAPGKRLEGRGEFYEHGLDQELGFRITFRRIGAGLANLGNTCFLNSVLQCLTYTEPFAAYLQSGKHKSSCRTAGFCAMCALQNHVMTALQSTGKILSPFHLVKNLRCISRNFRNSRQEDAHEYMVNLLESMHKCCLPSGTPSESPGAYEKSLVHKIFGGRLRSQVKCMQCHYCSNKFDPFLDLSLEIAKADTLKKALSHFTTVEQLDGGQKQYQCQRCKEKVRALKQLTIHKPPHVLTVHLKRFSSYIPGQKIDRKVEFEPTLDLKPFVSDPHEGDLKYVLYGVLVHAGWSTHSGHYYCFVRTSSGMWHSLDDNQVSQVSEKTVLAQKAYMLFYVRDRTPPRSSASAVQKDSTIFGNKMTPRPASLLNHAEERKATAPLLTSNGTKKKEHINTNGTDSSLVPLNGDVKLTEASKASDLLTNVNLTSKDPTKVPTLVESSVVADTVFPKVSAQSAEQTQLKAGKVALSTPNNSSKLSSGDCLASNGSDASKSCNLTSQTSNNGPLAAPEKGGNKLVIETVPTKDDNFARGKASTTENEKEEHASLTKESGSTNKSCDKMKTKSKKIMKRPASSMFLGPKQLLFASLMMRKNKKLNKVKKQRLISSNKAVKSALPDDLATSDQQTSTSACKAPELACRDTKFRKRKHRNSCTNDDDNLQAVNSEQNCIESKNTDQSSSKLHKMNENSVAEEKFRSRDTDANSGQNCDERKRDDRDNELHKMNKSSAAEEFKSRREFTSLLMRGLREISVPCWDDIELPKTEACEADRSKKKSIGYMLDEWDEEYDRGRRKKVKKSKQDFNESNPFQDTANKKAKHKMKRLKYNRTGLGNQPFRI